MKYYIKRNNTTTGEFRIWEVQLPDNVDDIYERMIYSSEDEVQSIEPWDKWKLNEQSWCESWVTTYEMDDDKCLEIILEEDMFLLKLS